MNIDHKLVKLQIWDTAGQERFHTVTSSYYHNADGVIIVYDVTNRQSFDAVERWNDELEKYVTPDVCKLLVGNKSDLCKKMQVSPKDGKLLAKQLKIPHILTSAKDSSNVNEAFIEMAKAIKKQKSQAKTFDNNVQYIVISEGKSIQGKSSSCC